MPKLIAIDAGSKSARFVLADVARGKARILSSGDVALSTDTQTGDRFQQLGEQLAEPIAAAGGSGAKAIVFARREDVDVRRFALPPSTDDELAEMVAAQVLSDSGDDAVVDFVAPPSAHDAERRIEAVVASEGTLRGYATLCDAAGVKLHRIVLRPHAVTALLSRTPERGPGATLVMNLIDDEIDLLVAEKDVVHFWRTSQLAIGAESDSAATLVAAELARTLAVIPAHTPPGVAVGRLLWFGASNTNSEFASTLAEQTGISVESIALASFDEIAGADSLENASASAPLVAALLGEANGDRPAIDLQNPRKPPKPRDVKRLLALAALALIVALFLGSDWIASMHAETADANRELQKDLSALRDEGRKLKPQLALAQSIAAWENSGVVWLDELRDLSLKFPTSQDVLVRAMSINSARDGGALIHVSGSVSDPSVVVQMDSDLRDAYRNATSKNYREESAGSDSESAWRFETTISTHRRSAEAYRAALDVGSQDRTAMRPTPQVSTPTE